MPSEYSYESLTPTSIRLLKIVDPSSTPIKCSLHQVNLDDGPIFIALSYAWDNQTSDEELFVSNTNAGGSRLCVTRTLLEALPYLSSHYPQSYFWIDAISINQNSLSEKSAQIPLMKRIYTSAASVVVWLGKPAISIHLAIVKMPHIIKSVQQIKPLVQRFLYKEEELASLGLPGQKSEVWRGLLDFFDLSWFHRTWTLQEALLPSHGLQFLCADHLMDWRMVYELTMVLMKSSLDKLCRSKSAISSSRNTVHQASMLFETIRRRQGQTLERFNIIQVLYMARKRSTKLPHDKVYALLGFCDDIIRENTVINYECPASEVFIQFSRQLILLDSSSSHILHWASAQLKPANLPSWCPDWNIRDSTTPLNGVYTTGEHASFQGRCYLCPTPGRPQQIQVTGLRVDQVTAVTKRSWCWKPYLIGQDLQQSAAQTIAWMEECHALTEATLATSNTDAVLDVFRRAIIGDRLLTSPCNPHEAAEAYKGLLDKLCLKAQGGKKWPEGVSQPDKNLHNTYIVSANFCHHRRFYATRDGRVGLGPDHVRQGDIIIAIPNSPWPFVLRLKGVEKGNSPWPSLHRGEEIKNGVYELVGETYLHGIMWGELVPRMLETGNWKTFILE